MQSPRVISCEELEKGESHVTPLKKDQTDGLSQESLNGASHLAAPKEVGKTETPPPSVLDALRLLNIRDEHSGPQTHLNKSFPRAPINAASSPIESLKCDTTAAFRDVLQHLHADGHLPVQVAGQNQCVSSLEQEASSSFGINSGSTDADNKEDDFQPPPKVQNIAAASKVRT